MCRYVLQLWPWDIMTIAELLKPFHSRQAKSRSRPYLSNYLVFAFCLICHIRHAHSRSRSKETVNLRNITNWDIGPATSSPLLQGESIICENPRVVCWCFGNRHRWIILHSCCAGGSSWSRHQTRSIDASMKWTSTNGPIHSILMVGCSWDQLDNLCHLDQQIAA